MLKHPIVTFVIGLTLSLPAAHAGSSSNTCSGREQCDILSAACDRLGGAYVETTGLNGVNGMCTIYS